MKLSVRIPVGAWGHEFAPGAADSLAGTTTDFVLPDGTRTKAKIDSARVVDGGAAIEVTLDVADAEAAL